MNLDPYFIPCTNINSKWVRGLNLKTTIIKFSEENLEAISLCDFRTLFVRYDTKTISNNNERDKKRFSELKTLMLSKGCDQDSERITHRVGENLYDKGLLSKTYKELLQINSKMTIQFWIEQNI